MFVKQGGWWWCCWSSSCSGPRGLPWPGAGRSCPSIGSRERPAPSREPRPPVSKVFLLLRRETQSRRAGKKGSHLYFSTCWHCRRGCASRRGWAQCSVEWEVAVASCRPRLSGRAYRGWTCRALHFNLNPCSVRRLNSLSLYDPPPCCLVTQCAQILQFLPTQGNDMRTEDSSPCLVHLGSRHPKYFIPPSVRKLHGPTCNCWWKS